MRRTRFGIGTALIGGGLNVLLAIVKHPPHVLYFVAWGLVIVGLFLMAAEVVAHLRGGGREPEFASREHRNELRDALQSWRRAVEAGLPCPRGGLQQQMIEAHYPALPEHFESWNELAERRFAAPQVLRERFDRTVNAMELGARYNADAIIGGFATLTQRRAEAGMLHQAWSLEDRWSVWQPQSGPADGARVDRFAEVAISMHGVSDEEYKDTALDLIAPLDRVLVEAQSWPEAQAIIDTRAAVQAFDRQPLYDGIDPLTVPERVVVAKGCPVCGKVA